MYLKLYQGNLYYFNMISAISIQPSLSQPRKFLTWNTCSEHHSSFERHGISWSRRLSVTKFKHMDKLYTYSKCISWTEITKSHPRTIYETHSSACLSVEVGWYLNGGSIETGPREKTARAPQLRRPPVKGRRAFENDCRFSLQRWNEQALAATKYVSAVFSKHAFLFLPFITFCFVSTF